jgi:NTP pyrophosphatase (non-canonical NTP hydrolase)
MSKDWREKESANFYYNHYCPSCGVLKSLNRHIKMCALLEIPNMNFKDYQEACLRTASDAANTFREKILMTSLGLGGESGEYQDLIKKLVYHGHSLDINKVKEELGDILWYLSVACSVWGMPLEEVARYNIEKLRQRYPEGFSPEHSRDRN